MNVCFCGSEDSLKRCVASTNQNAIVTPDVELYRLLSDSFEVDTVPVNNLGRNTQNRKKNSLVVPQEVFNKMDLEKLDYSTVIVYNGG